MNDYYVYLASLDGIPRYIGFGKKNRYLHVNSGISSVRKLNEIVLKDEKQFQIEFLNKNLTLREAEQKEIFYIGKYGRENLSLGTLWNLTDGGIGFRTKHTKEEKIKIGDTVRKRWQSLTTEERQRQSKRFSDSGINTRFVKGQKNTFSNKRRSKRVNYQGIEFQSIREAERQTGDSWKKIAKNSIYV